MKNVLIGTIIVLLVSNSYAQEVFSGNNETKEMKKPSNLYELTKSVCSDKEFLNIIDIKKDVLTGQGPQTTVFFDKSTIKYNKKANTIQVWSSYIDNSSGREDKIKFISPEYSNYGYSKIFKTFNLKTNKVQSKDYLFYDCYGIVLDTINDDSFVDIISGSIDQVTLIGLKEELKIK